jgi:phosphoribosylformylglycinamidine synthase
VKYVVTVNVYLRDGIADPEGMTIAEAARALDFGTVSEIHAGKTYRVAFDVASEIEARRAAEALAERLLSNPVIQRFEIEKVSEVVDQ